MKFFFKIPFPVILCSPVPYNLFRVAAPLSDNFFRGTLTIQSISQKSCCISYFQFLNTLAISNISENLCSTPVRRHCSTHSTITFTFPVTFFSCVTSQALVKNISDSFSEYEFLVQLLC